MHIYHIVKDFIFIRTFDLQDSLTSDSMTLSGYYGTQQNVQGLVQLNLMEPPHDASYYVDQQSIQGLVSLAMAVVAYSMIIQIQYIRFTGTVKHNCSQS